MSKDLIKLAVQCMDDDTTEETKVIMGERALKRFAAALAQQAREEPVAWRFKQKHEHTLWNFSETDPEKPTSMSPNGWGNAGHWNVWEPLYLAAPDAPQSDPHPQQPLDGSTPPLHHDEAKD